MRPYGLSIISLLIILFPSLSQYCPNSIAIDVAYTSKSCEFRYIEGGSQCLFDICYYKSTFNSRGDPSGWKQCFNQCCSSDQLPEDKDSIELLVRCQQVNKKKTLLLIVLLTTLLSAGILSAAVIMLCLHKKSCPLYRYLRGKKQKYRKSQGGKEDSKDIFMQNIAIAIVDKVEERESTLHELVQPKQKSKPHQQAHKNIAMLQSKCSICLSVRSTCQLNCGHYFHVKCLGLWFERGNAHAPCGDIDVRTVWVHCQNCMNELPSCSLHKFKSKFRKGHHFLCSVCRKI